MIGRTHHFVVLALSLLCATDAAAADPSKIDPKTLKLMSAGKQSGDAAVDAITADEELAYGETASLALVASHGGLVLDETLVGYVNEVGNLVSHQGKRRVLRADGTPRTTSRRVTVGVLDDATPASWSLPGGYIYVTRGLLELLGSESELAWVLGREVAHIDAEDGLRAVKMGRRSAAMVTGLSGAPRAANAKAVVSQSEAYAELVIARTGMNRESERAADKWGLEYAVKAGYDADGVKRVLSLLATLDASRPNRFKQHETPGERYRALAALVAASPGGAMGVERYDASCLQRLEAFAAAKSKTTPTSAEP